MNNLNVEVHGETTGHNISDIAGDRVSEQHLIMSLVTRAL